MFVHPSVHTRLARMLVTQLVNRRRGTRPTPARVRARVELERLEDRCLLSGGPTITEFPLPASGGSVPNGIVAGPDGNVWFALDSGSIGMINPTTQVITEFPDPGANPEDIGIAAGPDGNLWFTDAGDNAIGTINPTTHIITKIAIPTANAYPYEITAGPDGNLWFTELDADQIGQINPKTHVIREFPVPTGGVEPWFITAGPNGNLWFTEAASLKNVGEINPTTDAVNEFPMPATHGGIGIASGSDGNLWIGDGDGEVGQVIPTSGVITEFNVPGNNPVWAVASGPDRDLWFTENLSGSIGQFNVTTDVATVYSIPYNGSVPGFITAGPDGTIWFTDQGTGSIGVVTLNADYLVVTRPAPATLIAGTPFGLAVEAEDSSGNLDSSFNGTVTVALASNPGNATLGGTLTATASNGVATFSGLTLTTAATGYTLQISATGVDSAATNAITVTPAAASKLVIETQPSATATAGQAFATQPVVEEVDPYGNVETGDNSTVITAELSSGIGPIQGTTTATVSGGVAAFTDLADNTAETLTLKFLGGGFTSASSSSVVISPAAASKLVVVTEPPQTAIAGQAFTTQPVVYEEDQYGNLETGDSSTVVTASLDGGFGPLQGTVTATVSGGVARFAGLADDRAEAIALTFVGGSLTSAVSSTIVVTPAAASQLVIQTQPSATATAGQAFVTQPVIDEEDPYGNRETGDNSTVVTATLSTGAGPLLGATATVSGGVATFTSLADDKAETISIQFQSGSLTGPISSSVVVSPAAASKLVIQTQPSATATAGQTFAVQPVIEEEDQYGNREIGDDSTVVTAALASGAGPLQGR